MQLTKKNFHQFSQQLLHVLTLRTAKELNLVYGFRK